MTESLSLTSYPPLVLLTPFSKQLLARARELSAAGQRQFAVILAHAACELATEDALNRLVRHRADQGLSDVFLSFVPNRASLEEGKVRNAYGALTGDFPAGQKDKGISRIGWWDAWKESRVLRHRVAHVGAEVDDQQARSCLDAVGSYMSHIEATVDRTVS